MVDPLILYVKFSFFFSSQRSTDSLGSSDNAGGVINNKLSNSSCNSGGGTAAAPPPQVDNFNPTLTAVPPALTCDNCHLSCQQQQQQQCSSSTSSGMGSSNSSVASTVLHSGARCDHFFKMNFSLSCKALRYQAS